MKLNKFDAQKKRDFVHAKHQQTVQGLIEDYEKDPDQLSSAIASYIVGEIGQIIRKERTV